MMRPVNRNLSLTLTLALGSAALPALAQTRAVTADDYSRAEKFMGNGLGALVYRSGVRPVWLADERFWYRNTTAEGSEFVLVDPAKGTRELAFDHAKLAATLSTASGAKYDGAHLPFQSFTLSTDSLSVSFTAGDKYWKCDRQGVSCAIDPNPAPAAPAGGARGGRGGRGGGGGGGRGPAGGGALSPDNKSSVFIRDNNLWMRDVASGKETQLTTDGEKDFGYSTDNAGWTASNNAVVLWSPDSKKIATYQQDQRGVGEMYLVNTTVGHPTLQAWKYPLPGDKIVTTIQRVVIDVTVPKVVRLQMPADQHRSTLCDDIKCAGTMDVQWNSDGTQLMFVSTSRDHKVEQLKIADAATGAVRDVFEEKTATFYESGAGRMNWHYLPDTNEFIWFSEQSNWGQLYLYDLTTGKLKNQITTGEGNVTQINRLDEKNRVIYFQGVGKEKGRDPYFTHLYSVGFDGKHQMLLTPDDGNHAVEWSPSFKYFVDTYSKPDVPPVAALRDATGRLVTPLEKADISKLLDSGWKPPQPITMKARDGVTDIYGLMFKPANLDAAKKYPIINHIYPGPQTGSVGSRSFSVARGDCQALAELGFVVVEIDGMGTPSRSKKFHEAYFGDMGDNTLPDQVAGMKELARKYPWIDIEKVGIYGHSGGGYATAGAMFHYPDFFKVGISESGNHDNRVYEDDWAEKWMGLDEKKPGGNSPYDNQANQNFAKNLKGHLLLAHGTVDNNVPPYNTLLVVSELIKANKDFDLILFPNRQHGYGADSNYMTRRRWDYFVRYLMGAEPPKEFEMRPAAVGPPGGGGE
jgi:dipeptidyl aminopeptidase/acylaminoacyl peptidase